MSKSGAPSATASASASASSHDPHSLPPNVKGLVQRYLAVSLPTINLTPELIDVLDRADVLIPPRIQVTMRWWKEDSACSLSVYPRLNSPLPEPIAKRQIRLRQLHEERKRLSERHQQESRPQSAAAQSQSHPRSWNPNQDPVDPSLLKSQRAQPSPSTQALALAQSQAQTQTQTQPRSGASAFLKKRWSGARLLSAFRKGKGKQKSTTQENTDLSAAQPGDNANDSDHNTADTNLHTAAAVAKPLPSLPDAAYPITVAYPVRCSLEQLHRYFLEMTSLTLEIQITPELSALASVPNLTDLFQNIHGTFSGVFPFTTVLQNDNVKLRSETLFRKRVLLGMVVFQAWSQDTSDVGDSSEDSESDSTGSVVADHPIDRPTHPSLPSHLPHHPLPPHHHHTLQTRQHNQHHPRPILPSVQPPVLPPHPQHPQHSQSPLRPLLPHSQPPIFDRMLPHKPLYPLDPTSIMNPTLRMPPQQHRPHLSPSPHQGIHRQEHEPRSDGRHLFSHQPSLRFEEETFHQGHRKTSSRPHNGTMHSRGPMVNHEQTSRMESTPTLNARRPHPAKYHAHESSMDAHRVPVRTSSRYPHTRIPMPDMGPPGATGHHQNRQNTERVPVGRAVSGDRRRRSQDTNGTHPSQSSRSRPRAGATAAAIGRLESVLMRGEDLLYGMRTSFALDPEEVHMRSARNLRLPRFNDDAIDEDHFLPYHESLPYWPSKSRFSLELSIPTAYLTSKGLLKGAKQRKYASVPLLGSRREASLPATITTTAPGRAQEGAEHSRPWRREQDYRQPPLPNTLDPAERPSRLQQPQQPQVQQDNNLAPLARRLLRRSGKSIQVGKQSPRSADLERLRLAQEQSVHPHYQSFLAAGSPGSSGMSSGANARDRSMNQRPQYGSVQQDQHQHQQPRKCRSYPPNATSDRYISTGVAGESSNRASGKTRGRRLSSNDRLQIRMNPKAGDIFKYLPGLFPHRSMSALVKPEYNSDLSKYSSDGFSSGSGISESGDGVGTGHSSSFSTDDDDLIKYGVRVGGNGPLGGRQSRLQKRPLRSHYRHYPDQQQQPAKRHQPRQHRDQHRREESSTAQSKIRRSKDDRKKLRAVHAQHFNFKASCQLLLTPEVMAACMIDNISIEVWKLNKKRQTMIELGSAKLPLHKVLSRIMHKTTSMVGPMAATTPLPPSSRLQSEWYSSGAGHGAAGSRVRTPAGVGRGGYMDSTGGGHKQGWRLEPSMYDIRSRQGTIIGQLDADLWIHPRSRSDSMVSAAA
ncbi:hypothetical protein BGZ51_000428 [Haplosporangium sp. Z 767]|nr:hypothetical protein BGZ51_000428 [Haplosporangium sp. Z 767]KAF9196734.1 hypothetical protein BGZ50_007898 [Haplosporangium sp. Z 11]